MVAKIVVSPHQEWIPSFGSRLRWTTLTQRSKLVKSIRLVIKAGLRMLKE